MGYRLKTNCCGCLPCPPFEWPKGTVSISAYSTGLFLSGITGFLVPNWAIDCGRFSGNSPGGVIDDFGTIGDAVYKNNRDCPSGSRTRWSSGSALARQPILSYHSITPSEFDGYSNVMVKYTASSTVKCGPPTFMTSSFNWNFIP